jgi:hypothetical protein
MRPALAGALPVGARTGVGSGGRRFTLCRDGTVTLDGELVPVADHVTDPLTALALSVRHHLAEFAPDHIFFHAGAVAVDGAAIVIPGTSRSGKTVLVEALVRAGATYYSDEYTVVDRDGLIHPYPSPVILRRGTERFGPVEVPPDRIASEPIAASLVVLTQFDPHRPSDPWEPELAGAGDGALGLLENAVSGRSRPEQTLRAIAGILRNARVLRGARGEVDGAVRALIAAARATG